MARDVRLMRPLAIGLASNVRWHTALDTVRTLFCEENDGVVFFEISRKTGQIISPKRELGAFGGRFPYFSAPFKG